jgi:hypothetical protein
MRKAFEGLTTKEINQVRMYGVTEAGMREAVEQSSTFRFSGPGMMAMSILSDAQEILSFETGEADLDSMRAQDACQTINRAKWIIATYVMDKETA